MLAGAVFDSVSQRQHLQAPEPHSSEVVAAGTVANMGFSHRGALQELRVVQAAPSPFYIDSSSTIRVSPPTMVQ